MHKKNATVLDESNATSMIGAGIGAGLPITAGLQDYLRGRKFEQAVKDLDKSKFVSHRKLKNLQQFGDFGMTLKDYAKVDNLVYKILGGTSSALSGTGMGHGVMVGPNNAILHYAAPGYEVADIKLPKGFSSKRVFPDFHELVNVFNVGKPVSNFSEFQKLLKTQMAASDFLQTPKGVEEMKRLFAAYSKEKNAPQMVDNAREELAAVFRPVKNYTKAEKNLLEKYMMRTFHPNYNVAQGLSASLKQIFLPSLSFQRSSKTLKQVCDISGHCGTGPAGAMQLLGIHTKGNRNVFPGISMADSPSLKLEYLAGKGTPTQIKRNVLKLVRDAIKTRALIGLGAAAGLGGLGAYAGKKLPSDTILNNVNTFSDKLKNFINLPAKSLLKYLPG